MSNLELIEGTTDFEEATLDEIVDAFIEGVEREYNSSDIKIDNGYYTISSPSPKSNYCGYHKTLYCPIGDDLEEDIHTIIYEAVRVAKNIAAEIMKKRMIDLIEGMD